MATVKIPSFLTNLDHEKKGRIMEQYINWKSWEVAELLVEHLENELDKLVLEDEKPSTSWFQTKWGMSKRLGRREELRNLIKDLK